MRRIWLGLAAALALTVAADAKAPVHKALPPQQHWVGSWSTPQQIPEPRNALPPDALNGATLRQVVHLSLGGKMLRVHITNVFGTAPLHIVSAHIARLWPMI